MNSANLDLVWIDLEMTGLNPETDKIIEIATIISDSKLEKLIEGPNIVIHQNDDVLSKMDDWNRSHHGASGLIDLVVASHENESSAEKATLDFLNKHLSKNISPMCGNSVCQDRQFLRKHMPDLHDFFHYRNIDVSTLKELQARWSPELVSFEKKGHHRAFDDIKESIAELRYYRLNFFTRE